MAGEVILNGTHRFQEATQEFGRSPRKEYLGKEFGHEYRGNGG